MIDIWEEILDMENIGIDDDYIELGGHSISAIRIISRIHKVFEVELGLKEFFDYPTIRNLNRLIEKADFTKFEDIKALAHQPHYDVSHSQKRLWILDNLEDNYTAYNLSGGYLFEGRLDQNAFKLAFKTIVLRHESFRTSFINIDGSLRQKINLDTNFEVEVINLQQSENYLKAAEKIAKDEASYPFDLEKDDLIRVKLLELSENRHILIITIHHIVFDGWSFGVLENELAALYNAFAKKQIFRLPDLRIQYKEYSAWQNKILKSEKIDTHKTFWHNELNGLLPVINLPTDHPRPAVFSYKGKTVEFIIDSTLTTGIKTLAKDNSVSLFMALAAALKALIYRYTGQNDIIIGTPIAGRSHPDLENQIGFYVNTLAIRDEVKGEETFNTLLSKVKQTTTMAYEHQIYPFDRLVQELDIQRDVSRSPVFDVMLVLQNNSDSHKLPDDLKISPFNFETGISQFDLTFEFAEIEDRLVLNINYNTDLFEQGTVKRIESHFEELIKSAAEDAGKCQIRKLNILSEAEKKLVLIDFNDTKTSYPADKTIIDIFEEQVKLTPDNIAVIFEDKSLSYKELNELADTMAFSLRKNYRIEPDDIVGVITHRNEQMIISLLGIMKAGGAYLPIDPEYPQKRIDYMIKDSGCKIVLSSDENFDSGAGSGSGSGSQETEAADFQSSGNSLKTADSANLAYVIYTSGSTGQPKGVMIEHGGFVNMITAQISGFSVNEKDRVLQFASPSFDASLSEIFMALLKGAAIVLIKKDTINDKDAFLQYIEKLNVSVITFPPVYLKMLERHPLPSVKTIITAGEPAIKSDALFYSKNKNYFNAFGPTEASVCTSFHKVDHKSLMSTNKSLIPVGGPIANSSIYIIDNEFNPVPIGLSGEICFSGPGLSRGYLNRLKLTREKFIDNPFVPGERLYKTGDRGRWLPDGNIEFEGRKDDQQKIRGHRVEPGEIQGTLIEHLDIKDALVLVRENLVRENLVRENELVAYVISESSRVLNSADLRLYLNKILPSYMIPSFFVFLKKFPMTVNGKIDKKALPHHLDDMGIDIEYASPRNEIEEKIVSIWQKFFVKEKIGIHDNFFDMGGDSIRAIQMVSYLHQENLRVKAKEILLYPTIALLSDILSGRLSEKAVQGHDTMGHLDSGRLDSDQETITGIVPLTAVSSWFFKEYKYERHHFNHVSMFHSKDRYDENGLRAVFAKLQEHHDIFRIRYEFKNRDRHEKITQYNCGLDYPLDFTIFDLTDMDSDMAIKKLSRNTEMLQTEIDLENGHLMKIALFKMSDGDRLLVIIHHLIFDRVSWSIFIEDLNLGYARYISGKPINFPPKTDSFKKWAEHIELYSISDALMKEKTYWQSLESDFVSGIESGRIKALPYDSITEQGLMTDIVHASISLSISETEELLARADRIYRAKIDEILLTALAYAMKKWHGCDKTLITLEGHGREDIIEEIDVNRTIGWFTSTWPAILDLPNTGSNIGNNNSDVWDASVPNIEKIKTTVRSIPNKGIGYGILKYLTPFEYKNDMTFCLNPEINFNYLGQFKEEDAGFFEIAKDSPPIHSYSPDAEIIHNLDIAAMIADRKLHVNFAYNSKRFKEKTIDRILTAYHTFLKGIAIS
ncbi:amino acid adenylation domain-containing protein [Desulfobacterales bacterium HSG16]|nr:amino acid adenylation domain-containing protein [Desulfobacterales bacterium HSG16]